MDSREIIRDVDVDSNVEDFGFEDDYDETLFQEQLSPSFLSCLVTMPPWSLLPGSHTSRQLELEPSVKCGQNYGLHQDTGHRRTVRAY